MATNLKNIWVLDDDQSIRWVIEKALNRNGYIVKTFDSVEDAMDLIGTSNPDLILSDVRMPGKSGLDFLEIVKRDNPQIPVIIMTAYSDVETTVDSYKAGAYEYISKPFDINDLLKIVNKASSSTKVLKTDEEKNNNDIDEIIGKSNKMQKVYNSIGKLSSANVLPGSSSNFISFLFNTSSLICSLSIPFNVVVYLPTNNIGSNTYQIPP